MLTWGMNMGKVGWPHQVGQTDRRAGMLSPGLLPVADSLHSLTLFSVGSHVYSCSEEKVQLPKKSWLLIASTDC